MEGMREGEMLMWHRRIATDREKMVSKETTVIIIRPL